MPPSRPKTLLELLRGAEVPPELQPAWSLLLRGLEHRPFARDDLHELLRDLPRGHDHVLEELALEPLGDRLRISFLGDEVRCEPQALLALLQRLADTYDGTLSPPEPAEPLERLSHEELTEILLLHDQCMNHKGGKRADLSRYLIERYDFSNRNLESIHFDDSVLIDCSFAGASLYGATFSDTKAVGADFRGAMLAKAELHGADLRGACFDEAKLGRISLIECNLARATFRNAALHGAVIAECDLRGTDFSGAELTHASFQDNQEGPPEP